MPPRDPNAAALEALAAQPKHKPQLMLSAPGIRRDGTRFSRNTYTDGLWSRFWLERPKKMGGYREQVRAMDGVARHLNIFNNDGFCYVHAGSTDAFMRYAIYLPDGTNTGLIDRTPAAFTADDSVLWQSDNMWDEDSATTNIFAVPLQTLDDITSNVDAAVYFGGATAPAVLAPALDIGGGSTPITTTGGLCVVGPYLFLYGHDGNVQWSVPFHPRDFTSSGAGNSRPVADKIVRGMPLRGSSAPAIIMWSLSSLIVGNFGGANDWQFYTVSTSGSLLSQNGIVEHNGIYYWANTNGFSMFAGTMQDIKNDYNQQFFLDNLNYAERQKVFAFKIPRWKEIWWCFPTGSSTECDHAVILNYETGFWYDTPLPNGGRGAGQYDVTYRFPIMSGVEENDDTMGTSIWQHEIGVDEISGPTASAKAIKSSFTTNEFTRILPSGLDQYGEIDQLSFAIMEPDFNQVGNLYLDVYSRSSARSPTFVSPTEAPYLIPEAPTAGTPDGITFRWTQRLTAFKITSNEVGGDYFAGAPLIHMKPDAGRRVQ